MKREWITPEGEYSELYSDMLSQTHLLIAGATGAGKSTVVNGMMHAALYKAPSEAQFILIDPKGCELDEYRRLPHTLRYAETVQDCVDALEYALRIVYERKAILKRQGKREWSDGDVYVIIDELMILMTRVKKAVLPVLQDLLSLARFAHVHVIACTQSPIAAVIPTQIKCNFDSRLGLRTVCAQDSRNILGAAGCETFPDPVKDHKAYGCYRHGCRMETYNLTRITDAERQRLIDYWQHAKPRRKLFGR